MPAVDLMPKQYAGLSTAELLERIAVQKKRLGSALCILGHHYQRDEIIQFADFTGDSLKLSQQAAGQKDAAYIVFCGVHFMAESADILSSESQSVILPNLDAGCSMAEMIDERMLMAALDELSSMTRARIIPISYVNSSGAVKAVTGQNNGACCTSGNVRNVFEWAFRSEADGGAGADKILSVPDQHLGRNTAVAMGYGLDDCVVYNPAVPNGGLTPEMVERARFILWKGHCYVHQFFKAEQIERARAEDPGVRVVVHPECPYEVVQLADLSGSTEQIISAVASSAAGTHWVIGTEQNLVHRLAKRHPEQRIRVLSDVPARCVQMQRIDPAHLLWALDRLVEGEVVNRITVPADIARDARIALERMVQIKPVKTLTQVR